MTYFSAVSLLKNALSGNERWEAQWPDAEPKKEYDVIIVGAGGHGLGAAYYLAKEHGNDHPGVMLAGTARTYLNRFGVKVGERVVVLTSHDSAWQSAFDLADAALPWWRSPTRAARSRRRLATARRGAVSTCCSLTRRPARRGSCARARCGSRRARTAWWGRGVTCIATRC